MRPVDWFAVGFGVSTLATMGCAPISVPLDEEVTPAEFQFQEDADPVMAALPFLETELLAQPFPGVDTQALDDAYAQAGVRVMERMDTIGVDVLEVPEGALLNAAARLAESERIEYLQKSYIVTTQEIPNDPDFGRQGYLSAIRAPEAWDVTTGDPEIVIAVVDTGVAKDHPELQDKLLAGWNTYEGNGNSADVLGHGTYVAGVVGASADEGVGVAGVTWNSPILPVRVADPSGRSTSRYVAAGILWAVEHGARVINVSFAPLWSDRVVRSSAEQAYHRGSLVVFSAGNGGGSTTSAGYPEGIFVGAVDEQSEIAAFSDRGPFVDLVAPGTAILSTARGGEYGTVDGTSFAAPMVTGAAALIWSVNKEFRPRTVVELLTGSATDAGPSGIDSTYGNGLLDVAAAVQRAAKTQALRDTHAPTLTIQKPQAGAMLSGRFLAQLTATDDDRVADVVLSIDGLAVATDSQAPFQFVMDSTLFSVGDHELSFVATDDSGNASSPRRLRVTFGLPSNSSVQGSRSMVEFVSPRAGSIVTGDVTLRVSVSDPDGLAVVEWLVDGASVFVAPISGTSSGVSYRWRVGMVPAGPHTVTIVVTDATGERTTAESELIKS